MLEDGLGYPLRGDWIGRTLIGGVLLALSFLFLPVVLVQGYLYRVLAGTIRGEDTPPAFGDWGELFGRGLGVSVIGFAYSIVPVLVAGVIVISLTGTGGTPGAPLAGAGTLGLLGFLPVLLVVYYLVPAAVANYADTGALAAGFDLPTILGVITSGEYLLAALAPIAIGVGLVLAGILLGATGVGALLVPVLQFYGQVAVFRLFGSAFRSQKRITRGM